MLPTYVYYMVGAYERQRFSTDRGRVYFYTMQKLENEQDIKLEDLKKILNTSDWTQNI